MRIFPPRGEAVSEHVPITALARDTLVAFLATFLIARVLVLAIMLKLVPNLYLHVGRTHVHHLNYGIVLLTLVGAGLLFLQPEGAVLHALALIYGVAVGLTYDEFGMWVHLGGPYWQRASFDAITVVAATLALIGFAPDIAHWRPAHWWIAALLVVVLGAFVWLLIRSLKFARARISPFLRDVEASGPS